MIEKIFKGMLKAILVVLIAFVISVSFLFFIELKKSDGNATKATMGVLKKAADTVTEAEPVYVLLLGVNDNLNQKLTDTIILMGYNPQNQKAFLVSIPRDTFIGRNKNTATSNDKINSLYVQSPYKLMNAVEELTNVNIDYYVAINNKALIETVDIIGGVQFDVPIDMKYDDRSQNLHINLNKGVQIIDGEKAEQLLRFRHNNDGSSYSMEYGDNDYGRMRTQREFIMATINQCLETKSSDEIIQIIKTIFDNLETNMSLSYILSYMIYAYEFDTEDLVMEQLPGESNLANEAWIFEVDTEETTDMMQEILQNFNKK